MRTLLTIAILFAGAAGVSAFDFGSIFGRKPAALKELTTAQVPAASAPVPAKPDFPLNIKPLDVKAFIEAANPVVIDVRRPEEYAAGHLEAAALQLDYYAPDFKERLGKLDKGAPYLIYCRSGHRSGLALGIMKELGFTDIHDIEGGITAWTAAGLPVVK